MRKTLAAVILIAITALSLFILTSCKGNAEGFVFGTYYSYDYEGYLSRSEMGKIEAVAADIDAALSVSYENSLVYALNASGAGGKITLNTYAEEVYLLSSEIYAACDGAFNPASFPLTELWKFSPDTFIGAAESVPSEEEIAAALALSDFSFFTYDAAERTLTKSAAGAKIDFGAVAKGYAADKVFEALIACDVKNAVVDIGGTIRSSDEIELYVADPRNRGYAARVMLDGKAVSTSGDYQRCYFIDGVRYHHIMDKTGHPAGLGDPNAPISVTIVGYSAAVCDALSTAVMVLGYEASVPLVTGYGCSALIITETGYYTIGEEVFEILTERQKLN